MIILNCSYSAVAEQLVYVQKQDPGYGQHVGYEQQPWGHDQQPGGYEVNSVKIRSMGLGGDLNEDLSEIEGAGDMYKEASKENCAIGLEDKLSFIHTQFEEIFAF